MNGRSKNRLAASAAVAAPAETPYTRRGDGMSATMTGTDERLLALDRKLTEGFNLVHARLTEMGEDIREIRREREADRREASAQREADRREEREERAKLLALMRQDHAELRQEFRESNAELRQEFRESNAELRQELRESNTELKEMLRQTDAELKGMIRDLTKVVNRLGEQTSAALERSAGFAWTRRQVVVRALVGIALLIAGAVLGPLGAQLLAALGGG